METNEQLYFLDNCNKQDFINFAKEFNVFKTLEEPNYLLVRDKILSLLDKLNLTNDDIIPNPRIKVYDLQTQNITKNDINIR